MLRCVVQRGTIMVTLYWRYFVVHKGTTMVALYLQYCRFKEEPVL